MSRGLVGCCSAFLVGQGFEKFVREKIRRAQTYARRYVTRQPSESVNSNRSASREMR